MSNKNPTYKIPKGTSGNAAGSSNKIRVRKSKLRTLANSLRELEPKALATIKASVEGKKVDSEQLASSKWVCTSLVTIEKAALSEEVTTTKLRIELLEINDENTESPEEIGDKLPQQILSLVYSAEDEDD